MMKEKKRLTKKITAITAMLLCSVLILTGAVPVSAEAAEWGLGGSYRKTSASFYLLKEGLNVPVGTASQPSANYEYAGKGTIKMRQAYYNENGVDAYLGETPAVELKDGQFIIWYVIKQEGDGWHVDGVVVPFYSFVYDPACDDATGATTDGTHYYRGDTVTIQENEFARDRYEFTGWNTEADGSGTAYIPGQQFTTDTMPFDKSINVVTLYAQWQKKAGTGETEEPDVPAGEQISLGIVCPKKMSVRFEDGTICYGGENISLEIGKEYRFQMCSNNWDNDTYTDDGNGICGTVVYTVRVSDRYDERSYDPETKTFVLPKGDPVLRTDVNKCFMAYRYHFKQDYNKQTGIVQVVNTPLESLSVNLPLGSTIRSDAYIAYEQVGSAYVFVENDPDMTISYTNFNWPY